MEDCIFCKIINGDIPSKKVYENDDVLAIALIATGILALVAIAGITVWKYYKKR